MRRFFVVCAWVCAMGMAGMVCAQLPQARLSSIIPPGGKMGSDVEVTASGTDLDEASGLRFSHPVMVLVDASGRELEHARGMGLIDFVAPVDGSYILKLHDAIYRGSSEYFYRLSVGTAPHIDFVMPPCGAPGTRGLFVVYGRNLPGGTSANIKAADGKPLEQVAVQIDIPADSVSTQRLATSTFVNPAETALDGFEYRLAGPEGVSNPFLISYASGPVVEEMAKRTAGQAQALSEPL